MRGGLKNALFYILIPMELYVDKVLLICS